MKTQLFSHFGSGIALTTWLFILMFTCQNAVAQLQWLEITKENKPWTRWWWMGSSVDKKNISALMEKYKEAGLGGLEITPIYGVAGYEDQFIDYLSDEWIEILMYSLKEAERLDLGIDMATGTGWPFGGPWVSADDACKYITHTTYTLKEGEILNDKITYVQEPLVRAVGNQIYQSYGIYKVKGEETEGSPQQPLLKGGSEPIKISDLKEPVSANENLQALALDQVRFEKPMPLQALMAYSDQGETLDLTAKVDKNGKLNWKAPRGNWTLYAVFQGWHGKMVERAAPGGEGNVIDHFSETALKNYLQKFDKALAAHDINTLRAFFNDSYEVDDANGQANWTADLFEEFQRRHSYDLRQYLPALFGNDTEENNQRVLTDYRETVSDLLLEKFTQQWKAWAKGKGAIIRNQSHGSPANILDLYGASDIPETEGNEILRFKFATSAAHVTGKPLVSAEAATWLNEHFTSTLADVKKAVDRFFLGGVNHIFYHGTNYSPPEEAWPGWLFYAAVHFTPANSFWRDFDALNHYVARCQSFLQAGKPDHDILLYYPIYDYYAERGEELLAHFDGLEEDDTSSFKENAEILQERGYAFDFISDKQLESTEVSDSKITTGGIAYQTLILPECQFMPLETLQKLIALASDGATIMVHKALPASLSGMSVEDGQNQKFEQVKAQIHFTGTQKTGIKEAKIGKGAILLGDDMEQLLAYADVRREPMVERGLQFIRRKYDKGHYYFVANWSDEVVDAWVPLQVSAQSVAVFDPMMKKRGLAQVRNNSEGNQEVYVQLSPGGTCILQTFEHTVTGTPYYYYKTNGNPTALKGTWTVSFIEGGPSLPPAVKTATLGSWTDFKGEEVKKFSGTVQYTLSFPKPAGDADAWRLSLGKVSESASVKLNGKDLGTLLGPDYAVIIDKSMIRETNTLEVEVSNLMGNRIADLDKRNVGWKKFYNINFPARLKENRNEHGLFDASDWKPKDAGLIGPVSITPVEQMQH